MNDKDIKMQFNKSNIKRFTFLVLALLLIMPSCQDDFNSSIPYVPVNFSIRLTNYNHLKIPSNSDYFPGGYGGVIVINSGSGYYANDATCPFEIDINCRVETEGGVIATCPCCGSKYNLLENGSVIKGPSPEPLKPYRVNLAGSELFVTN